MSSSAGPDIITNGLILHLDAADRKSYPGSGTVWRDRSGNGYQANMRNLDSSNWVLIDGQRAFETNRTPNQGFTINSFALPTSQRTYSIWLKSKSFSISYQTWFDDGNENILFGALNNQFILYPNVTLNANLQINIWYNFAYTLSGTSAIGYINGLPIGSGTYLTTLAAGVGPLVILGDVFSETTSCYCSCASVYNRTLSPQEIKQNFNATKSRFGLL